MPYKDLNRQKEVATKYYKENKQAILQSQNNKRNKLRQKIQEVKESTPCADCKIQYPHYVMDFDHLPGTKKKANIGGQLSKLGSMKALKEEMAKCEVVCANCHRHRTFLRKTKASSAHSEIV